MKQSTCVSFLTVAALCASLSCNADVLLIDGQVSARARVMGKVLRPDGTPLPRALVTVHLPDSIYNKGYTYNSATTDTNGRFQAADVLRIAYTPSLGGIDTITAYVVANALGAMVKPGPGVGFPTDSTRVLIRFYDSQQEPVPAMAIVHVVVP